MSRVGIITGLLSEAQIVERAAGTLSAADRPLIAAAGGDAGRARELAAKMAREGACGLVSFGLAGGLDPALRPGALLLPAQVFASDGVQHATAPEWRARMRTALAALDPASAETIAGSDRALIAAADKAALGRESGASAVDMESHGVAQAAREAELPFLVVRAVADPADRAIPKCALVGMGPQGEIRTAAIILALMKQPRDLPGLCRLARDSRAAMTALRRAAVLAGPVLFRV